MCKELPGNIPSLCQTLPLGNMGKPSLQRLSSWDNFFCIWTFSTFFNEDNDRQLHLLCSLLQGSQGCIPCPCNRQVLRSWGSRCRNRRGTWAGCCRRWRSRWASRAPGTPGVPSRSRPVPSSRGSLLRPLRWCAAEPVEKVINIIVSTFHASSISFSNTEAEGCQF